MKRSVLLVSLVVILSLLVAPLSVLAQAGDKKLAEFKSADELLTASYPEEWFAAETADFPGFAVATSEKLLNSVMDSSETTIAASGDAALQVILMPADVMGMLGMEVTAETTLDELTQMIADQMVTSDTENPTTIGEPEVIEVALEGDQKMEVGKVNLASEKDKTEGYLAVFSPAEGIYVIAAAMTYTGEMTEELDVAFMGILGTVDYAGTAADLMNALMGGGPDAEATPEVTATPAK